MIRFSDVTDAAALLLRPTPTLVAGHRVVQPPLLSRLITGVLGDTGRTRGGAALPSERNALNLGAFTLYEDISGRLASMAESATDMPPDRDPRVNLTRWLDAFELAWHRGQIVEAQIEAQVKTLKSFALRINEQFDPATPGQLIGACPNCGEHIWYSDSRGSRTTALYTLRRDGYVEARCHWCDSVWTGQAALTGLAQDMSDTPPTENADAIPS
jgi:hypothetical protein